MPVAETLPTLYGFAPGSTLLTSRVHAPIGACCIGVDADVFAVVRIPE